MIGFGIITLCKFVNLFYLLHSHSCKPRRSHSEVVRQVNYADRSRKLPFGFSYNCLINLSFCFCVCLDVCLDCWFVEILYRIFACLPDSHLLASSSNIKFSASFLIPLFLANKSVVSCPAFAMSHFSPKEIKSSHSVAWPSLAANINGVYPSASEAFTSDQSPCLSTFMSAPASISNLKLSR